MILIHCTIKVLLNYTEIKVRSTTLSVFALADKKKVIKASIILFKLEAEPDEQ